ncbi:MAG: electron transport complex subunit RsxC [Bacteroides sp.]|nr:electron transport complex subunit RsxC [Bacteroides sp.]
MKRFRRGGIHPSPSKLTAGVPILDLPVSDSPCRIMLSQHIGKPARPLVKPGEHVEAGQMIAEADGFVSAPVHSPVSGKVKGIEKTRNPQGLWRDCIVIIPDPANDEQLAHRGRDPQTHWGKDPENPSGLDFEPYLQEAPEKIIRAIADAGIVGLGGATFPSRVKLTVPEGREADTVVINGAECEPFLTCDDALMRAEAGKIIAGVRLIMRACGASKGIVGIEANKPEAIEAMKEAAKKSRANIDIEPMRTRYPQGSEKQLIQALTGRKVPAGGLPIDARVVVQNVATAFAVYEAVVSGKPLTSRIVTVTGPEVISGGNFLVPLGTPLREIIDFAGGLPAGTGKVIAGGPMMGRAVSNLDAPSEKGLGGILILPERMSQRPKEVNCIRCGRCVEACPMGLEPYLLATLSKLGKDEELMAHGIRNCLECGCCSYICPSARPLVDFLKLGKSLAAPKR